MSKVLEALDRILDKTVDDYYTVSEFVDEEDLNILKQALTPPTEEEMCKALSDYYGLMVRYDDRNNLFQKYVGDGDWVPINIVNFRNHVPHLITLIGIFYEWRIKNEQ